MDAASLWWIAVALLVALGVVGTVLPGLPGAGLVLAGLTLGAWIDDFAYVGARTLVTFCVLTLLCYAVDLAASALGAKKVGAHRRAVIGAAIGTIAGLFFGLPGILLGPFLGAVVGELSARGSLEHAAKVGIATWIGMALGGAAKLALVLSMLVLFVVRRWIAA